MLIALLARLQLVLAGVAAPRRVRAARGITFIEYAILAAIAVAIGFIFRNQLGGVFDTLLGRLRDAINIQ